LEAFKNYFKENIKLNVMRKRLAIAINMLSPYWHDVFERLVQKGWKVTTFVSVEQEKNRLYNSIDYSAFSFDVVKSGNIMFDIRGFRTKTDFLHLQWGLWRDLRLFKPDIILSNQLGIRTLIAYTYGTIFFVPVIPWVCVSLHTERKNCYFREYYRKWLLKRSPSICTNLTEGIRYLTEKLYVVEEKIFPTPYVVDVDKLQNIIQKIQPDAYKLRVKMKMRGTVFLYAGQMIKRKGLDELATGLQKVDKIYRDKLSFIFVGGQLPKNIYQKIIQAGIHFVNVGFVQPKEMPLYYAMTDVFIFPSLEDEWAVVINEAAAAGLPIISSIYAAATTDLVEDYFNGLRIDPYQDVELAESIEKMMKLSNAERKEWGQNSLLKSKKIDLNFTVENMHSALNYALSSKYKK
jgi:glycosyltransferase involved in cell wall biosynthesis